MYLLLAACMLAAMPAKFEKNPSGIRTMPVSRTPEPTTVALRIAVPKEGKVLNNPVWIQFRIDGYPLEAGSSQFERASELVNSKLGQTVHVVIDNEPYFPVNEQPIDPFDEATYWFNTSYKFKVPFRLSEGMHTIRMFPTRSFGESLKGDQTFASSVFYIGEQKDNPNVDLSAPYITYNESSALMYLTEDKPVLLDFYVTNTELSPDGYKVRLTIDGNVNRMITTWQPYYIYGLKKGRHTVRLELIDEMGNLVPGEFNKVQQTITIH